MTTGSSIAGEAVAVIGIGCWYPDAPNPARLWENILARRRAFRRLPDERLPLDAYFHPDKSAPDKTYGRKAAVIDGFDFDWVGRRIPRGTFEGTDIAHWLALEVALQALDDAGYGRDTLPRERTSVIVGNTLTGEQSRSLSLRVRWPFVERAIRAAANSEGFTAAATYGAWQGRLRDKFFYELSPEHFCGRPDSEPICTNFRMTQLREAMPLDRVRVEMRMVALYERAADLSFHCFRVAPDGSETKLAVGQHTAVWGTPIAGQKAITRSWPPEITEGFLERVTERRPLAS